MKKISLIILILVAFHALAIAQKVKYKEVKNTDLTYVLNNIEKTTSYTSDKRDLFIKAYLVADPSGSAHVDGDDEITNTIYIAVSEDGEAPEQHLYRLTPLYGPKFVRWVKTAVGPELVVTYGAANKKRTASIRIALKQLVIH